MNTTRLSPLAKALFALSLLTICAGCQTDGIALASKQAVKLPPAPSFLAPVAVPVLKEGEDAREGLAKALATLKVANARLTFSRQTYDQMRKRYGGSK